MIKAKDIIEQLAPNAQEKLLESLLTVVINDANDLYSSSSDVCNALHRALHDADIDPFEDPDEDGEGN